MSTTSINLIDTNVRTIEDCRRVFQALSLALASMGVTVTEADISLSDVTTDNVSITKHGFTPKLPNDATKYLDGTGAFSVPTGGLTQAQVLARGSYGP